MRKLIKVKYSSNNSGGSWWLSDKDWKALEKAGWYVKWGGVYFCHSRFSFSDKPEGKPEPHSEEENCPGHRRYDAWQEADKDRYMGALARDAEGEFPIIQEAIKSFEKATGQDVSDEGCNCCGPPHSFNWEDEYASGEDLLEYMFPAKSTTLTKRQLLELGAEGKEL